MDVSKDKQPVPAGPLVSVIVPVHNHARFVVAAIQSVLDQTYRPIELIVIDDGSSDGSAEIVREFLRTCEPQDGIEVSFTARENKGAAETINEGLRKAKGEYLAILNSDDLYAPSRLAACVQILIQKKARLLATYVHPIDEAGADLPYDHPWRQWYYETQLQEIDSAPSISFLLLSRNIAVSSGNLIFHRSVVSDVGLFAPYKYVHGLDFLLRFSLLDEIIIVRKALYLYRIPSSHSFSEKEAAAAEEAVSAIRKYLISCLSGECRNPVAPSFENWPASFNQGIHGLPALRSALDSLLHKPVEASEDAAGQKQINADPAPGPEITVVSHELSRTGAPMLVLELARSLKSRGHRVNVISMKDGELRGEFAISSIPVVTPEDGKFARWLSLLGVLVPRLPILFSRVFPASADRITRWAAPFARLKIGNFFIWLSNAITLPRLAAQIRGTLLINSISSFPLALGLLSRWNGPALWYIHETVDPQIVFRTGSARKDFDSLYSSKRIKLLFGSEATRATWAQYGFDGQARYWSGIPASKIRPRGALSPERSHRTILSVGTGETRKGTRWLLEAFAHARVHGWIPQDVELIIVGCRQPSIYMQARDFLVRAWKSDLRGAVRLVPSVSPEVLEGFYRDADLYVQTSIMECLPLTLLTAMAHGLPIVSTDVDGCKEAIQHGETGLLIPPRSIEPLAQAMADLLSDPTTACSLGDKAREKFVTTFSLEATLGPLAATIMGGVAAKD